MRVIHTYTLVFLGITLITSCNSVPVPYMKLKHGGSSGAYSTTVHGRLRRAPCEVSLFYDVACHGICPTSKKYWEKNRLYLNCTDGLTYHCAKDNTTGEYVEACAEPVRCERGKEPRIVFPAGHEKTAIVVCRYCDNGNFYNPYEFKLSSTYYKCPEVKIKCNRNVGQIDCHYEKGVERYYTNYKCRCDVRKGYFQVLAVCPTKSPCQEALDLKCVPYQCDPTSKNISQELLKDYCCKPVCDEGYQRNETSDVCDPISISSTLSTATTRSYDQTTATKPKTETNAIKSHIETTVTVTTVAPSVPKENASTTTTTTNTDTNGSLLLLVIILSVILGAIIITGILVYGIKRSRQHNKKKPNKRADRKHRDGNEPNRGDNCTAQGIASQTEGDDTEAEVNRHDAPDCDGQGSDDSDDSGGLPRREQVPDHSNNQENGIYGYGSSDLHVFIGNGYDRNPDWQEAPVNDEERKPFLDARGIASQNERIHEQDEDHNGANVAQNSRINPANHNGDHDYNPTLNGYLLRGDVTEAEGNRHDAPDCDGQGSDDSDDSGGLPRREQVPDHSNNQENGIYGYGNGYDRNPDGQEAPVNDEEEERKPLLECEICGKHSNVTICTFCNKRLCPRCSPNWHKHHSRPKACRRFDETTTQDSRQFASNKNQENKNHNSGEVSDNPTHDQDHRSQNVKTNSPVQRVNVTAHTEGEESIQNRYRPGKTVSLLRKDKFLQPRTHTQERKTGNRHCPREPEIKIILPEKDQHNIDEMNVHLKFKTGGHPTQTSTANTALEIIDDCSEGNIPKIVPNDVEQIDIEAEHDEETGACLEEAVQFDKSFQDVSSSI